MIPPVPCAEVSLELFSRVLRALGDALYAAGEFEEALGRYEASAGHLERTRQGGLYHVQARIEELRQTLAKT